MKVICSIIAATFLAIASLHGQVVQYGLSGGITVSQVDGDLYRGYYKAGATAGGYWQVKFGHFAGLRTELRYTSKGSSDGNQAETNSTFYRMHLHYLELPVLGQYYNWERVNIELGTAIAYLVSGYERDEYGLMPDSDPFRSWDLNGIAGVYYRFLEDVSVYVRFSYSLFPIRFHAGGATWYENRGQYNNVLAFGIQYRLYSNFP